MDKLIEFGIHAQKILPNSVVNNFTKNTCSNLGKSRKHSDRLHFAKTYKVNWKQASRCKNSPNLESCVKQFRNLDAFFQRQILPKLIKPESTQQNTILSPAESYARKVSATRTFKIKGIIYTLSKLIQQEEISPKSTVYIFRLAPEHYHRIHSPTTSTVLSIKTMGGNYHSVNPIMLESTPVLQENYRKIITFTNGLILVAIGATCIGSVHLSVKATDHVKHGQDLGTFGFGGSCLVLIVPNEIKADHFKLTANERHINPGLLISTVKN
jgi:hypothetical protein